MKKIKIAHIITELERGGAQFNTLFTIKTLPPEKYKRILITNTNGVLNPEAYKLNDTKRIFIKSFNRNLNIRKDILTFITLFKILKKERPHIIHTHSSKAGILGRWAALFAKVPIIIHTIHGFGFWYFTNKLIKRLFILIEVLTSWFTDVLVVVSTEDMKIGLSKKIGKAYKYEIIRSGIDIKSIRSSKISRKNLLRDLGISSDEKIILKIAPFKKQKAPLDFIRMAKILKEKDPKMKFRFLLIGGGKLEREIKNKIKRLELWDNILLLGWKEDPIPYLKLCDIFVLTSEWEGLPRTFLEAMACKKPIVATNVGGAEDVVKNEINGYLVPFGRMDIMADRIYHILKNKTLQGKMGKESGRLLSDEFDINVMVKELDNLYLKKMSSLKR